jgi:two-component system, NtrC family, response regulator AtoC
MQPESKMLFTNEHNGDHYFVLGTSSYMQGIQRTVLDIAATDIPVLILGESGTGKGALALRIHNLSRRRQQAFVKLNCAALTQELARLDGAGRRALEHPANWFNAGTIFLDEIGDLDLASQARLLYAIPDEGNTPSLRVISSTQRNLEQEMRSGRFREDLYYRLNGVSLMLPPLRRRKEDIPLLIECFLTKYSVLLNKPRPAVTATALHALVQHSWPGNIRELEFAIQKLIALGDEQTLLADIRNHRKAISTATGAVSLKEAARVASREAERELILRVLSRTRWNRKRAARDLQISYKALLYKLKQMGLNPAASEDEIHGHK